MTAVSVFADQASEVFTTYHARIELRAKLMGGIPKNPKIVEGWLRAKAGINDELEVKQAMRRTLLELDPDLELSEDMAFDEMVKASEKLAGSMQTNGFKLDDHGLYIEDRQVKALLKECTNILFASERWGKTKKGPKAFVSERVFVAPDRLYLDRAEPDGIDLVVGHVQDRNGRRSTVTYHEYCERPVLEFDVMVAEDVLSERQWASLWVLAQENGIGALRSQSHGRFDVTTWKRV